jgi:uncharacterized membrane protein HdeD (DUF308 family)
MTIFEKIGVFLARITGIVLIVHGALELIGVLAVLASTSNGPVDMLVWPLIKIVLGIVVFAFAKPIGHFLGGDLA